MQTPLAGRHRAVLDGVPRVGFYGDMVAAGGPKCPEDMPFPSCLRAVLRYLGDDSLGCKHDPECGCGITACGYGYLMGICGQGFMLNWNPSLRDFGSGNVLNMTDDAVAPVRWALEGLGYGYQVLGNAAVDTERLLPVHGDEPVFRHAIIASIEAGRPVLGFGVVGPPECCIITGYDQDGDVLTGWSFFQSVPEFANGLEHEANGYFRKRHWFADTLAIVVLAGKVAMPQRRAVLRSALERALAVMSTPRVRGTWTAGVAAFDAWTASLTDDERYANADRDALRRMYQVHNDTVGNLAEYRAYCSDFLRDTAGAFPTAADEIRQADGCFAVEHDLMWRAWECLGGHQDFTRLDEEPAAVFSRPEARRCLVAVVREAGARDAEAMAHIATALTIIDAPPDTTSTTRALPPRRVLLDSVRYVGFDAARTGGQRENTWMCSAMRSALEYLGQPASYQFLMGVSGCAFRLSWNPDHWDGGNISTLRMGEDPMEHYRRAFGAVGWVPQFTGNAEWRNADGSTPAASIYMGPDYLGDAIEYRDEARFRELVIDDIHYKRYPLLSIGTVFPPECGIVCGYDDGGDAIIGWQAFQHFPENAASGKMDLLPTGQYRKRDWFIDTVGLIGFHYKTARPNPRDAHRDSLAWALEVGRKPSARRYVNGLAAYEAWAEALGRDDDFAGADADGLALRLMCHNDAILCISDGREQAAGFLRSAVTLLPVAAAPLTAAAGHYDAERETVGEIIAALGGFGWDAGLARNLARPDVRHSLIPLIHAAKQHDDQALGEIERAYSLLSHA